MEILIIILIVIGFAIVLWQINKLQKGVNTIMANVADAQEAFNELKQTLSTEIEQINQKLDEIENGGDTTALVADIREATARIKNIIPDETEETGEDETETGGADEDETDPNA